MASFALTCQLVLVLLGSASIAAALELASGADRAPDGSAAEPGAQLGQQDTQPAEATIDSKSEEAKSPPAEEATTQSPPGPETGPPAEAGPKKKEECEETLCLNGGTCLVMEDGSEKCFCPEAFWGARCQLRNICKSVIADNLTGDQICNRIGRACIIDDKLFRCQCGQNEFFLFKADHFKVEQPSKRFGPAPASEPKSPRQPKHSALNALDYDAMLALVNQKEHSAAANEGPQPAAKTKNVFYLAECRSVNRCLGVRCRQMSEVCEGGECVCNQNLGYIQDPQDGLCKLLNPCAMPRQPGQAPVCGQARCLPTYDKELYRCVCPIGYYAVQRDSERSSIQCAILSNFICLVPLLNKCQHVCEIDGQRASYKCSCYAGYKSGARPGIDDHLCFFRENLGASSQSPYDQLDDDQSYSYDTPASNKPPQLQRQVAFKPIDLGGPAGTPRADEASRKGRLIQRIIVLEASKSAQPPAKDPRQSSDSHSPEGDSAPDPAKPEANRDANGVYEDEVEEEFELGKLSAQERCNMYCDENKICILENETTGSYRCVCDRQGYVSVGDKCLDWCAAAEFSHGVRFLLGLTCVTGICKRRPDQQKPLVGSSASYFDSWQFQALSPEEKRAAKLNAKSSWRPSLQCDCDSSPLVFEDAATGLCKLNFSAILEPCLPGNEGHTDCVINKHAYCAVLHKDPMLHKRGLTIRQLMEQIVPAAGDNKSAPAVKIEGGPQASSGGANSSASGKKGKLKDKAYVCVCSPEKKFLVDKPRNKARCVDECDLLSNECGRFNRMCRAATINSNEQFGYNAALVREDQDGGVRMNQFKRTGCECLPGFNVGPSEPRDFTLDTNYPEDGAGGSSATGAGAAVSPDATFDANYDGANYQRPRRLGWDAIEDLLQDAEIMVNNSPKVDQNVIQSDILSIGQDIEHLRTRYMNINSRCLLDYDVVEFHARFKAPADFEPAWVETRRRAPEVEPARQPEKSRPAQAAAEAKKQRPTSAPTKANSLSGRSAQSAQSADPLEPEGRQAHKSERPPDEMELESVFADEQNARLLKMPAFMRADMSKLYKYIVLVADCDFLASQKSFQAYEQCIRYRYWAVQKFRAHFADWRQVMSRNLRETFDLMDGNIRFRVNKCETIIKRVTSVSQAPAESAGPTSEPLPTISTDTPSAKEAPSVVRSEPPTRPVETEVSEFDPWDQYARVDADLDCKLTIHSASDYDASGARRNAKRVLLEKQLPKFIFTDMDFLSRLEDFPATGEAARDSTVMSNTEPNYYLLAPNALIHRESYDQLAAHRKAFSPCNSEYSYCDKQTRCEMQDTVNYSCTCEAGYTPIGSRDIYFRDSRKEVCEDINECLFDVCKGNGLEDKSVCVNEIGDYKCQCIRHHVGDNKRFCDHICNVIACKHGDCRIPDEHHAFCECYEGYREADCSVQDPSVALRKANMIICSSIFASVLLLAITLAISLNSQLKKTKKELKRLEAAQEAVEFYEFSVQQPPYRHRVSKASIAS